MRPSAPREADRPVGELLRELGDEIATLVRQEISLAQIELTEKAKPAVASASLFGATAMLALGAFGALTACFIAALALVLEVWVAALIVAVVYSIIALALMYAGRKKLREAGSLVPEQTTQTIKEDIEWAKTRAKYGAR
jgi:uncharacterized membrane protein YqjE